MNQVLPIRMTVDEFLAWSERQERGRFELEDGLVIEMQAENVGHLRLKGRVFRILEDAASRAKIAFGVLPDGATVRIGPRRAYEPDALVAPLPLPADDQLEINKPIIVAEVLSPSSARRDLIVKVGGYALVPSIEHYLVIDPDDRLVLHYRRDGERLLPPPEPMSAGTLRLDPPGLEFNLADLFTPVTT